jgi:hypothetical protein
MVVRLQIVEDKGFVAAIEKLANVDSPGVFSVGPATLQICGTIDVIIVRTGESRCSRSIPELIDPLFHTL